MFTFSAKYFFGLVSVGLPSRSLVNFNSRVSPESRRQSLPAVWMRELADIVTAWEPDSVECQLGQVSAASTADVLPSAPGH